VQINRGGDNKRSLVRMVLA